MFYFYSITGTIVNNSTQELSQVSAYAILYDKDNKVITVNSATADVSTLKPGDYSAFKVPFFNFSNKLELPDYYTLVAGGEL